MNSHNFVFTQILCEKNNSLIRRCVTFLLYVTVDLNVFLKTVCHQCSSYRTPTLGCYGIILNIHSDKCHAKKTKTQKSAQSEPLERPSRTLRTRVTNLLERAGDVIMSPVKHCRQSLWSVIDVTYSIRKICFLAAGDLWLFFMKWIFFCEKFVLGSKKDPSGREC